VLVDGAVGPQNSEEEGSVMEEREPLQSRAAGDSVAAQRVEGVEETALG